MRFAAYALIFVATAARADISDSGSLIIGGQGVIVGTMTVQGNAFSVGGATLSVSGGSVNLGGLLNASSAGIKWADGTTSTTAASSPGSQAVSSYTVVPAGSTSQGAYKVAFATVTLALSGNFGVVVNLSCSASVGRNDNEFGWSILYDGHNDKFGLSSTKGVLAVGDAYLGEGTDVSASFPIAASDLTAGSHSFALSFSGNPTFGPTVSWPSSGQGLSGSCRFGVNEIH